MEILNVDHYGNAYAPWGLYNGENVINLFTERELGLVKINDVVSAYARSDGYMDIIVFTES